MGSSAKYQIFVSSTYDDLRVEREAVIRATLELGHIPVGMEMFSAADEEQWKIISRQIDQSDYYAVVVAHRYGSTVGGISYTEKEYDYAISKKIPVLGFIIDDGALWPADRIETSSVSLAALKAFKEKLRLKPVGFWLSSTDLHSKFSIALIKAINSVPREGWVRASLSAGPEILKEISRLSIENASLRQQLNDAAQLLQAEKKSAVDELAATMKGREIKVAVWKEGAADWSEAIKTNLYRLFWHLAPELLVRRSTESLAINIAIMTNEGLANLRNEWPVPKNSINHWLTDLMALGLVQPVIETSGGVGADTRDYWTLTEQGREFLKELRLRQIRRSARLRGQEPGAKPTSKTVSTAPVTSDPSRSS